MAEKRTFLRMNFSWKTQLAIFWVFAVSLVASNAAILGIDFGTDYTKAALVAPGVPFEIVLSSDSKRKEPSGLAFKKAGTAGEVERIYGSATASHCTRFPHTCLNNLKPLFGKSVDSQDLQIYLESHPGLEVVESAKGGRIEFSVLGHKYPIEEALAMNIQNIVSRAVELLKEKAPGGYSKIDDVVVTVPQFFSQEQRMAIKDAVELAGLNTIALVDDGLAIAVNYATTRQFEENTKEYHIIYDMGAGSTKATLVSFEQLSKNDSLIIKVEDYAYDETLSGSYFTKAIAEIIKQKFLSQYPKIKSTTLEKNPRSIAKLFQTAEKAKLILSANTDSPVSIESLYEDIDFKTTVSREEFEEYVSESANKITKPILSVLENFEKNDINSVIYAGGSTRVPFVKRHLATILHEDQISKTINADESALMGATLRGVQISKMFKAKEMNITEMSLSNYEYKLGVEGEEDDESIEIVFPKNSKYDQVKEIEFTELANKTNNFTIDIFQNSKLYLTYEFTNVNSSVSFLDFNSTECAYGYKIVGFFKLSESNIFSLDRTMVKCDGYKAENSTKVSRFTTYPLHSKVSYSKISPLSLALKQRLKSHLSTLNQKDKQRRLKFERLNELEAILYKLRYYLEEDEVVEKGPQEIMKNATACVSDYLTWLEDKGDNATSKEIKLKIETIKDYQSKIETYLKELSTPLDEESFRTSVNETMSSVQQLQELMLVMKEKLEEIQYNFTAAGLDFEVESKKLALKAPNFKQEEIETSIKKAMADIETVNKLINDEDTDEFESLSREELFKLKNLLAQDTESIKIITDKLAENLIYRMRELSKVLNRYQRAKQRALKKEQAKSSSKSKSKKGKKSTSEQEEASASSVTETVETVEPTATTATTAIDHDEL